MEKFKGKEVAAMKRVLSILIAVTMVIATSGLSFADIYAYIDSATYTASSGPVGTPANSVTVGFNASLKSLSNDSSADNIGWSNITAGETGWKIANQYIEVKGFAVYSNWGIQIYTDNTSYEGTGDPAGLINTIYSLPMCWRTKVGFFDEGTEAPAETGSAAISTEEKEISQGVSGGYTVLHDGVSGHEPGGNDEYFPWFFMLDKNTTDIDITTPLVDDPFGNYQEEATFIGSAGYHHAPGDVADNFATPSHPQDSYYVYLGAKFTMATSGMTYTTTTLTVEMYHL
jgi:hypothetical protein